MNDEYFMTEALKEAQKAFDIDEVPIGAVIEHKGEIIGRGYNRRMVDERKQKCFLFYYRILAENLGQF